MSMNVCIQTYNMLTIVDYTYSSTIEKELNLKQPVNSSIVEEVKVVTEG